VRRHASRFSARAAAARSSDRGQASVEFVALLPLIVLVLFAAWQFLLAGDALWNARTAARAAARAQAVGADPEEAARDHLPERLERALRVSEGRDGDVRVSVHVPAVIGALDIGRVAATGHFDRQGS
jgi:Flp pilus assembly protein TadG